MTQEEFSDRCTFALSGHLARQHQRRRRVRCCPLCRFNVLGLHHVQDPDHEPRLKIRDSMREAQYTPRTWRTHPLHMLPPDDGTLNGVEPVLNWIFLVSALNFSFWSELGDAERYAVEWRAGWASTERERWSGYWSLVAAINRGETPLSSWSFHFLKLKAPSSGRGYTDNRPRILRFT